MVEANDRLDASPMQPLQHLAIAMQGLERRNDFLPARSGSTRRKAATRLIQVAGNVEVSFGILPPIARLAARITRLDPARLFPLRPLIAIVAFDLMGGGRHTPEKIFRKSKKRFGTRGAEFLFTHDLHSTISQMGL